MNSLVTLVVPTLNGTHYLRETLLSVLAQDYQDLDILVSDNGSRPETMELAKRLAEGDPRVRFRRNEDTVPIHVHFNQCLEAARGEFFIILSDDDLVSPNFVTECVGVAQRHADLNVVLPKSVVIDANGEVLRELATSQSEVLDGHRVICNWLYGRTETLFWSVATVLGRTAVLRHFGGYQGFPLGQNIDNLNFIRYALGRQVGFASAAVCRFRVHASSHCGRPSLRQILDSARQFEAQFRNHPETVTALARLSPAQQQEIIKGVRTMGVSDLLYRSGLHDAPFSLEKLRRVFSGPFDVAFYRLVLGHYSGRLADRLFRRSLTT